MASTARTPMGVSLASRVATTVLRFLASPKLAVALIVVLAAVLAWATFLEAERGRDVAQWYVYHSTSFAVLLALLALNITAAAAIRYPWRRRHIWFLVTHAGLLLLLIGSTLTFRTGIQGQLAFEEGETANRILITDHSQFTARWEGLPREERPLPAAFIFQSGPVHWPEDTTLNMGELSGVTLKVLRFYAHARSEQEWIADETKQGGPAIRFALTGPDGKSVAQEWLAAELGGETSVGPASFRVQSVPVDSMLEDFLKPPDKGADQQGVLSVHYQGRLERIPVSKNVGKKAPVGKGGVQVEIVEYLPNAKPTRDVRFRSQGTEPKNPVLELRVYLPDKKEPVREIAIAKKPLLSLDGIHGGTCPVKVWYHHPAITLQAGADFLQTPDGKLYCRSVVGGKYQSRGPIKKGEWLETSAKFRVSVVEHLPYARQKVTFYPVDLAPGETAGPDAAALVEVTVGDRTQELWLKRNDAILGSKSLLCPKGTVTLTFGYEYLPLDFSLKLVKFTRGLNPGRMGDASFTSTVQLVDRARGTNERREISMNQPLVHGKFRFYQSSFNEAPGGKSASILSVAYDPGRLAKYLGSGMICAGILMMFCTRAGWRKKSPPATGRPAVGEADAAGNGRCASRHARTGAPV